MKATLRIFLAVASLVGITPSQGQPATRADMDIHNLPATQARLAETFARDARLLVLRNGPNSPFDQSVVATYAISSVPYGRLGCRIDTIDMHLRPQRNLIDGVNAQDYEMAIDSVFGSTLEITQISIGLPRFLKWEGDRRRPRECGSHATYDETFTGGDPATVDMAILLLEELIRRQAMQFENTDIACGEVTGCRGTLDDLESWNITNVSNCADESSTTCIRFHYRMTPYAEASGREGSVFFTLRTDSSIEDVTRASFEIEFGAVPPPPPF